MSTMSDEILTAGATAKGYTYQGKRGEGSALGHLASQGLLTQPDTAVRRYVTTDAGKQRLAERKAAAKKPVAKRGAKDRA